MPKEETMAQNSQPPLANLKPALLPHDVEARRKKRTNHDYVIMSEQTKHKQSNAADLPRISKRRGFCLLVCSTAAAAAAFVLL